MSGKTGLTVYPCFTSKTLRFIGSVAVGEKARVRISGVDSAEGLRVRFRFNGRDAARFPAADSDTWIVAENVAEAVVNLNTLQVRRAFLGTCDISSQTFVLVVENTQGKALSAKAHIQVKNWPANEGEDVPYNLDEWPNEMDALDKRVTELAVLLESHETAPDAHDALFAKKVGKVAFNSHVATQNAHGVTLASLGGASQHDLDQHKVDTSAHGTLFDAKADADAFDTHTAGQELSHSQLDSIVRETSKKLGEHDHSGGGRGVRVRHSDLIGSGKNSHHQIDVKLAATKDALDTLSGEVRAHLDGHEGIAFLPGAVAEACRAALSMPDGSDRERKAQFTALAEGIAAAIEAAM